MMDKDDDVKAFIKEYREDKKATERTWKICLLTYCIGMLIIMASSIPRLINTHKAINETEALIMELQEAREN